ncbi:hypothetical protein Tco_0432408 [Tanacetum coccineum]
MSNRHQELASPKQTALCCTKALATPEQTTTGKEISNPLTADSLLKTIRTSPRVLAYLDNQNETLLQTLDLTLNDLNRLNTALNLNDFLSCLVDDLWASELTVSNFSPTDG